MAVYWIISKSLCQKMNMAVDLLDLNKKGQLSWLSDYPILFKFKWSISFLFLKQMIFLWVYFLKFHYKLILLGHNLNKSSKISFHEIRKIGIDWIANVTKCVFGWFKQVDVFWWDDKKKGKKNSQFIVNWAESSAYFYEKKFYFS